MKYLKFYMLALAFFAVGGIYAQTADEIIDKHIEAIGGKDKISQINSLHMESNLQIMGTDAPSSVTILNGKGYKTETEFNGSKMIMCYTDSGGWFVNPMMGASDPQRMPADQFKTGKVQLDIGGALVNHKEKGSTVELLGKENVGDATAYKLKVTTPDSMVVTYFIDTATYYVTQTVVTGDMMGQQVDITTSYSDFQKTDFGYVMPFAMQTDFGGQFSMPGTVQKVEINEPVDPGIFEMPSQ